MPPRLRSRVPASALAHGLTALWLVSSVAYMVHRARIPDVNLYLLQAQAFLDGTLEVPSAVQDAAVFGDKIFVPFPPSPAVLLLPLVLIFGVAPLTVSFVAAALVATTAVLLPRIFQTLGTGRRDSLWLTAGFLAGTGFWLMFLWSSGVWYFALVVGVTMLVGAIHEALTRGRGWVVGLWLGVAVLSRQMAVYSLIFLLAAVWTHARHPDRRARLLAVAGMLAVFGVLAAIYPWFNWVRFGGAGETGYSYIQHADFLLARFQQHGLFSLSYVPFNVVSMFLQGPHLLFGGPGRLEFLGVDQFGTSLTFASPFLFAAFAAKGRRPFVAAAALSVTATIVHQLLYHANGWVQVNTVRYTLDFLPVLMVLVALGVQRLPSALWKGAIAYSISLNYLLVFVASGVPRLVRVLSGGGG